MCFAFGARDPALIPVNRSVSEVPSKPQVRPQARQVRQEAQQGDRFTSSQQVRGVAFEPYVAPDPAPGRFPPQPPPQASSPSTTDRIKQVSVILTPNTESQALQPHVTPPGACERVSAPHPPPQQPKAPQPRFPVAVLSFFDGIGTPLHALKTWSIRPVLAWSWEMDPEAVKVASSQHPEMVHRGDVFGRKPAEVLSAVTASVPKDTVLLVFAAPPCHDFSQFAGTRGTEGAKFTRFAAWLKEFSTSSRFRIVFLLENVVMSPSCQQECHLVRLRRFQLGCHV